jgi:SAM-dependent methyltransferase
MSYGDNAFDFIYCKESYHHFPRPPIALYEMLRVARIGVVLTEPQDRGEVALTIARIVKRLRGRPFNRHNFETVGNYIYTVDRLEIEKLMLAVGLQHYAYRGINDFYIPGVEEVPLTGGGARDRWKRFLVHFGISVQDFGCRAGICRAGLVTLAIFKRPPEAALVEAATAAGFHFVELPKNPYR